MATILRYEELELGYVDRLLAEHGVFRLELDPRRAEPLAALLNITRGAASWRGLPLAHRVGQFLSGLWLALRILVLHTKLLSLLNVIVLHAPSQTWHQRPDGIMVFQFTRPSTEA